MGRAPRRGRRAEQYFRSCERTFARAEGPKNLGEQETQMRYGEAPRDYLRGRRGCSEYANNRRRILHKTTELSIQIPSPTLPLRQRYF